uniref:hypothetical protein n=1 Tax=Pedobacter schmidteae TaxID=2201271 RepID=UPI000EAE2400|nr:hypothetical protein [Pedobacter schmidteae]
MEITKRWQLLCLLLSATFICAIQAKAQTILPADTSFMEKFYPGNNDQIDGFFDLGLTQERSTLHLHTSVYAQPSKAAKITDTILPFTNVFLLYHGIDPKTRQQWLKVRYTFDKKGIYTENTGYITDELLSLGKVRGNSHKNALDFVLGKSPVLDKDLNSPLFRLNAVERASDKNYSKLLGVAGYDLNIGPITYFNHFYLTGIGNIALKNMPNLLRLYWHHGESCPESEGNVFIASVDGQMKEIISASATGEGVFYETTKVYMPLRFAKGKILLVENADSQNMFDNWNVTLKTIPYPKDCGIPINQLVVKIEEEGEALTDSKGKYTIGKDGAYVMAITHKIIRYYRWDGEKLQEVRKLVIKQKR